MNSKRNLKERTGWLTSFRRLLRDDNGISAIEFAFAAPAFFVLLIGSVDVARALSMHASFGYAAQEGARYAAIRGDDSLAPVGEAEVRTFVQNRLTYNGDEVSIQVTYEPNGSPGSTVTVLIQRPFNYLIGDLASILSFNVSAQSSFTVL